MKILTSVVFVTAVAVSGCSHRVPPENSAAPLVALQAETRVVRGETTLVTRGSGYELVGRTRADLATFKPSLDREAAFLAAIYPRDTIAPILAAVRRTTAPGKPYVGAAPLPVDEAGSRVELVLVDPKAIEEERKKNGGPPEGARRIGGPTMPAVRAWLSARAAHVTGTAGRLDQSHGESDDPRVPAWAFEMVDGSVADELVDGYTKSLALHSETVVPLSTYLTMQRPAPMEMAAGRGSRGSGESPPAGGRTGGGMGGGRGGMGGGRGGMGGRGGSRGGGGGGGEQRGSGDRSVGLQGSALFAAQAAVLAKYFEHEGTDVIGQLIDAQIADKSLDDVFAKRGMGTVQQVDADWRGWLLERANQLNRR